MITVFSRYAAMMSIAGLLPILFFSCGIAQAQTGSITGRVTLGSDHDYVQGINIVVIATGLGAMSDDRGRFTITDVPAGYHAVEASCIGYQKQRVDRVLVRAGAATEVMFALRDTPFLLDEVVVTGTLSKHLLKDTPVITEVMSSRDIAAVGSSDLADIMRSQTGIEIGSGIGQTQSAQLHGLSDNHVLVLVDGERVTGRVDGAVDLGQIPVQTIEKIEVVKGPLSAKYGSDAIGGVINIITRDPAEASRLNLSATVGGYGRQDYEASAAQDFQALFGEGTEANVFINAAWNRFGGVDYDKSDNFMELPERDRKHAGLKTALKFAPWLNVDLRGEYYEDRSEWLAGNKSLYLNDMATNSKWTSTSSVTFTPAQLTTVTLTAHLSNNDHTSIEEARSGARVRDDASSESIETYRIQMSAAPYASSILTAGYEYTKESAESDRLLDRRKAYHNNVVYAEDEWGIGPIMLSVGGRYSNNSVFGSFFAPRFSGLWKIDDHFALRASYGRGFRAPSINELYIDFPNLGVGYTVEGEPSLKAEKSHGYNAGLQYTRDDLVWLRVNAYLNDLTNLIDYYVISGNPIVLSYRNIADAVTKGVDIDIDVQIIPGFVVGMGYGYTVAQDGDGRDLPFRTPHMVTMRIRHDWRALQLRSTLRGRWFDRKLVTDEQINLSIYSGGGDAQFFHTPSYAILDFKMSRKFFESFDISAGVNNITDERYFPFGQVKGREWFAGLAWSL